jgi:stage IV sporulation protein FB
MMTSAVTGYFLELCTLFAVVFIHELGHVTAAKSFGWTVKEVQLLPFGGVAVVEQVSAPAREEIVVAAAGPLQNAIMIGFAALLQWFGIWDNEWGAYFIQANVLIGLFNLVPVLPLDGGKIMQAFLGLSITYHKTIVYCTIFSLLISIVLIAVSLFQFGAGGIQLNLLTIGVFLLYSNWYAYRNIPFLFIRFLMNRESRAKKLIAQGVLAQPIVVAATHSVAQIVRLFMRDKYHLIYVVNEKGALQAVLPEQRLLAAYFQENKPGSAVSELFM